MSSDELFAKSFIALYNWQHNDTQLVTQEPAASSASLLRQYLALSALSNDKYSLNDTIKELPSSSLRYVIVQYELANLWQNQLIQSASENEQSPQVQSDHRILQAIERRKQLNKAVTTFLSFLSTCDHLDAMTDDDRTAYLTIKSKFEGSIDRPSSQSYDPASVRANKIAKFKQNRELESKIAAFETKYGKQLFADDHVKSNDSSKVPSSNHNDTDTDMEDQMREYWLCRLQYAINKSLESIPLCLQEQEFLIERETRERQVQSNPQSASQSLRQSQQLSNEPAHKPVTYSINSASQLNQPIPEHMKQYLQHVQPPQPASTSNQRALPPSSQSVVKTVTQPSPYDMQQLLTSVNNMTSRPTRATVFRDPNPATISIEEWADGEIAAGRMPGPSAPVRVNDRRGYVTSHDDPEGHDIGNEEESTLAGQFGGEDDRQKEDAKTIADREWDNWKDDHERGAGNRNGGRS